METLTIPYPSELLWALQKDSDEFEKEARLLLALKLYETSRISTGLAAQLAGVPRVSFMFLLGQHGLSPFGENADELEEDLENARLATHMAAEARVRLGIGAHGDGWADCSPRVEIKRCRNGMRGAARDGRG